MTEDERRPQDWTPEQARAWADAHIRKPTDKDVARAMRIAEEQGWFVDGRWIWDES